MSLGKFFSQVRQLVEAGEHELAVRAARSKPEVLHEADEVGDTLLHVAACQPDTTSLHAFIDLGAPLEGPNPESHPTPLHFAASLNLVGASRTLADAGADVTVLDSGLDGGTPLMSALFYGAREAAEYLSRFSLEPDNLRVAAGLGNLERLQELMGDFEQASSGRQWYRPHDEYPAWVPADDRQEVLDEALWYASVNGRVEAVQALVSDAADPEALCGWSTALHAALLAPHHEVIRYLLDHIEDFTTRDAMYQATVAEWTDFAGDEEARTMILRATSGQDAYAALVTEDFKSLAEIAERGAANSSVLVKAYELQSGRGIRILEACGVKLDIGTAVAMGRVDLVNDWIEEHGPNEPFLIPTPISGAGTVELPRKPINHAAYCRQAAVVEVLRAAGASVDVWSAAAIGDVGLLEAFDDLDRADEFGRTPLHRAIQAHELESVRYLLASGASVDVSSDTFAFGSQALHVAAAVGAPSEILESLVESGADLNALRNQGTPLDVALENHAGEAAAWLREHGALTTQQMRHELLVP